MQSKAATVADYLAELPADRRQAIEAVRAVILKNLDKDYEEGMLYGMIGYYIPHSLYPAGYHCDPRQPICFAGLASQKNYMALYLMCVYGDLDHSEWFKSEWAKTGKKLDMGKSCIRFKKVENLALDVIGKAVKKVPAKTYLKHYEALLEKMGKGQPKKAAKVGQTKTAQKTGKPAQARKPARKKS